MSWQIQETQQFKADFKGAMSYITYALNNPIAADNLITEYIKASDLVSEHPYSCPQVASLDGVESEYRSVLINNYFAFYVIIDDRVEFRRFLHSKTDYHTHLSLL